MPQHPRGRPRPEQWPNIQDCLQQPEDDEGGFAEVERRGVGEARAIGERMDEPAYAESVAGTRGGWNTPPDRKEVNLGFSTNQIQSDFGERFASRADPRSLAIFVCEPLRRSSPAITSASKGLASGRERVHPRLDHSISVRR